MSSPSAAVLIPVKAFHDAKVRLAPALDSYARTRLARAMAATVVRAAGPLATWIVCDDQDVANWAGDVGAKVIWTPGLGLNGAVTEAVAQLHAKNVERVLVSHADLPHATDLQPALGTTGVTLVPDRREDGTNVVSVPAAASFRFSYGPGSFLRHQTEAERLGLAVRVLRDDSLSWDVDVPADLDRPGSPVVPT